jgi:multidrug transporter EmrE-like cation transporter
MKTKARSLFLMILFTLLSSAGQTLLKVGAVNGYVHWGLFLGLACYGAGTFILLLALRHGELSVVYPLIGLGFVWVTLCSVIFLHEHLTITKAGGMALILAGVSLMGVKR